MLFWCGFTDEVHLIMKESLNWLSQEAALLRTSQHNIVKQLYSNKLIKKIKKFKKSKSYYVK